jgi:hypothetical protein
MTRHLPLVITLVIGVGIGVATFASSLRPLHGIRSQQVPDGGLGSEIPSPGNWIPFSASLTKTDENYGAKRIAMEGRQYRRADGSDRLETGPAGGPIKVITIHNFTEGRFYVMMGGKWVSHPMMVPEGGYLPGKRRSDMKSISGPVQSLAGFAVYPFKDKTGVEALRAPDLNFFALRTSFDGTVQEFSDIQIGDQPDHLFVPPQGVTVAQSNEPAGFLIRRGGKLEKQ